MRLKLSDLQRVVKETLHEKKRNDVFCDEIKKAFGPSVVIKEDLASLAESANEHLDVLEYKGQLNTVNFSQKIARVMSNHELADVRKLAARLLPEGTTSSLLLDKSEKVRYAASKRASVTELKTALRKFPNDVVLREALETRRMSETKNALESAATDDKVDMLSEEWYTSVARKLIQDYGRTLDTTWKNSAVKTFCSSSRSVTRLPIDSEKLLGKINELLDEYEINRAKELGLSLKEGLVLSEGFSDDEEEVDPVLEMVNEGLTPQEFIDRFKDVANVKFAVLPPSIMKYKIREGLSLQKIPVSCTLPHGGAPRRIDEVALDSFVKHWNEKQKIKGEPFRMSWTQHPDSQDKISFKLELK